MEDLNITGSITSNFKVTNNYSQVFEYVKRVEEIKDKFKLPVRATVHSAGYDFYNPEKVCILPKQIKIVKTGVKAHFPEYFCLLLLNRSSNPISRSLVLANGIGLVESDYYNNPDNEGELGFEFMNISDQPVTIEVGEKLGQGMFTMYGTIIGEDTITNKRTGGFGSTDK